MRKILAFAIIFMMALSLTACGRGGQPSSTPTAGQAQASPREEDVRGSEAPEADTGEELEAAIAGFTKSIEGEPGSDAAYLGRGGAYAALGDGEKALADYTDALALRESPEAYLGLVDANIMLHKFEEALEAAVQGGAKTGDERLQVKQAELEKGSAIDAAGREHKFSHYTGETLNWYHITDYARDGRVYSLTSYDAAGVQTGQILYEYDGDGNNTLSAHFLYTDGVLMPREQSYDGPGRVVQTINHGRGSLVTNGFIHEYGADGRVSRLKYFDHWPDGLHTVTEFEWTDFGKTSKSVDYNPDGSLQDYTTYEYDDRHQMIRQTYYDAAGAAQFSYTYQYDENGNRISETRHES